MSHHHNKDYISDFITGPTPVFIESPFSGIIDRNIEYARRAMWDSLLNHNEAPILSHLMYTQNPKAGIVCDTDSRSVGRDLGIKAAMQLSTICAKTIVYDDYGITAGMEVGIEHAKRIGHSVEYRKIGLNQ